MSMDVEWDLYERLSGVYSEYVSHFRRWEARFPLHAEEKMLSALFCMFEEAHGARVTRQLFGHHGLRPASTQAADKKAELACAYGWEGKPPKLRFAKEKAAQNKLLKKEGRLRGQLWGAGAASTETMNRYVIRMLNDPVCRKLADVAQDVRENHPGATLQELTNEFADGHISYERRKDAAAKRR
jgi:hypothetical protein